VIHAAQATTIAGAWQLVADATAASGKRLWNPNLGAAKVAAPQAAPTSYVDLPFSAEAGRPYRLWLRGRAENNQWSNDSLFVQFSGTVTATGAPTYRIGTTGSATLILEDCSGCGVSGWGWQDNGYGTGVLGPVVYFAESGLQTIRLQPREDGISIDQIVLSPALYLTERPGAATNDVTILPTAVASAGSVPVSWRVVLNSSGAEGTLHKTAGCNGCPAGGISVEQISSAGHVEFVPAAGHRLFGGLSGSLQTGTTDLAHSFSFWPDGGWDIREGTIYRTEGRFAAGDRFRIAVEDGAVKYYKNGTLVYASKVAPALPVAFNTALFTLGAAVDGVIIQRP
jgi:hypothetical protein